MALNKAGLSPETLHKPPALFHAVPGSQGPFTFQNHYTPNAATFCAQEQQKRKGIWTGSSLKTHNGASDRQRRGEGEGKILMNLASFQEDIHCPCITFPLHHFNVCLKHKAGAATFPAGLRRSNPAHFSQTHSRPSQDAKRMETSVWPAWPAVLEVARRGVQGAWSLRAMLATELSFD